MQRSRRRSLWWLAPVPLVLLGVVGLLLALAPPGTPLYGAVRAMGLLGYGGVFVSALSSLYVAELARFFGRPFLRLHHTLALSSLGCLTLHPLFYALYLGDLRALVPDLSSWRMFWTFAGRPALVLLAIAALAGFRRAALGRRWRLVHWLTYVAFWMATVHALLLGTDLTRVAARATALAMALAILAAFVAKRRKMRRVAARRPRPAPTG